VLNITVAAPIPMATTRILSRENPGRRRIERAAKRMSESKELIPFSNAKV
jgi:hypothetical protein